MKMISSPTRLPLAIALSTALAFAVGCAPDADDRADMTPADEAAMETTPDTTPTGPTDPVATGADPYADPAQPPAMGDAQHADMDDGRDSDQPVDDTWITTKVKSSLLADNDVSGLAIDVETVNGVVALSGQVESQAQIDHATRIARDIEGVTNVDTTGLTVGAATE
ncbi:BON domain-containing protein [Luteimonas viscosa]|uniref:Osmotically-inducible protein Y n=1 Tax=Luteimonas viscosa TaxID=1132694 RepID=A0A5D4XU22_9GAMM|nr:BON domain-containing protein [Luteimonas viscosa]TYT26991.1 BON domain-containing protein [Luteimonas viscosa]